MLGGDIPVACFYQDDALHTNKNADSYGLSCNCVSSRLTFHGRGVTIVLYTKFKGKKRCMPDMDM